LLKQHKAKVVLLINSKDSKFYDVLGNNDTIKIHKSRITLNTRTYFQLALVSQFNINFSKNSDLNDQYDTYKSDIKVGINQMLALSNVERYDGEIRKPYDLFKTVIMPELNSAINIDFEGEFIRIGLKDKAYNYESFPRRNQLRYHYVYMGLYKALSEYIRLFSNGEDMVILDQLEEPSDPLFRKLHRILITKCIERVKYDNIDKVIYDISDRIIEKHYEAIKELSYYEN
jgi:hypothetical protein